MSQRYPSTAVPSKSAGAFYATYFGVLGAVLPYLGPFLADRGLGPVSVGLATAAFSLAKLAYTPLVGRWVDRGRWFNGILTAHMALAVAASALVYAAREPWLLAAALLVVGVGYGTVLPLVEAAVLERMPSGSYGRVRWWGSIGFVVVAGLSATVVAGGSFGRFPALLTGLLVVLTLSCLPLESVARPVRTVRRPGRVGAGARALLIVLTFNQIAHGPYYAFLSIHLRDHGFGAGAVAALWSLAVLAELVAFALGPRLEGRFGRRMLLGLALGLAPVRWLLLALPPTVPVLLLAQLGHAVTFAVAHLAGVQLVQEAVPAGARRNAQALYSGLCFGLGIVVGTAAAGPLYAAVSGSGSFLAAAGLSALVALAWWGIGRNVAFKGAADSRP